MSALRIVPTCFAVLLVVVVIGWWPTPEPEQPYDPAAMAPMCQIRDEQNMLNFGGLLGGGMVPAIYDTRPLSHAFSTAPLASAEVR